MGCSPFEIKNNNTLKKNYSYLNKRKFLGNVDFPLPSIVRYTAIHVADALIQSDLQ